MTHPLGLTFLLACSVAACTAPREEVDEEDAAEVSSAVVTQNALTVNALTANALTANALTANALTANALTANALTMNELSSVQAREVFRYIVGCALPAGSHIDLTIDGQLYSFAGELGLAAAWGQSSGSCDAACVSWVSGCVISRLNKLGVSVPLSLRGAHPALAVTAAEQMTFYTMDGAYYGNIFSTPMQIYACFPPWGISLQRVCGSTVEGCAVTVAGWCNQTCDKSTRDGSYPNCRDGNKGGNAATTIFPGSVTVYLQ
jgi:hypothetical protein